MLIASGPETSARAAPSFAPPGPQFNRFGDVKTLSGHGFPVRAAWAAAQTKNPGVCAAEGFSSGLLAAYVGDSDPDGIPVDLDGG